MYFEKPGRDNTEKTIELAHKRARELGIHEVVVASSKGYTAHKVLDAFKDFKVVVVTYHGGFKEPFQSVMPESVRKDLEKNSATVISATHALSGVERSLFNKYSGAYPVLIIADTLRLFGQGTKVAVEIAIMASDGGTLSGKDIVSIGGTGKGADAALIIKPANQSHLFDLRVREVVCKPSSF